MKALNEFCENTIKKKPLMNHSIVLNQINISNMQDTGPLKHNKALISISSTDTK